MAFDQDHIIEMIRKRPGMYIGDVHDGSGLVQLVWEVLANSLDEHLAGRCTSIQVEIQPDGSVVVEDDGRGIPIEDVNGVPFAQVALTSFHETPTLDGHAPHEHIGLRGVGLVAVNALSATLKLDTHHRGRRYTQRYERGIPVSPMEDLGPTTRTGTRMHFLPDEMVFSDTWINAGSVTARLRELACLLPSLTTSFADRREHRYHEPRGLRALLQRTRTLDAAAEAEFFTVAGRHEEIGVEAVMKWHTPPWTTIESYANIERTTEGGTHVRGLVEGLVDGFRAFAWAQVIGRKRAQLSKHLQGGLSAVVCVRLNDPTYGAPTKSRLETPKARDAVRLVVAPAFTAFLTRTPSVAERLLQALASNDPG